MAKAAKYLVGSDGSEWSARAVQRAVSLARQTGAAVEVHYVINWSGFSPVTMVDIEHLSDDQKAAEANVEDQVLAPLRKEFGDKIDAFTTEISWGHPVEVIHERAKEIKAAMVFVGRRGRSKVADLLMGSVANSLAHKAGVPIVLVP